MLLTFIKLVIIVKQARLALIYLKLTLNDFSKLVSRAKNDAFSCPPQYYSYDTPLFTMDLSFIVSKRKSFNQKKISLTDSNLEINKEKKLLNFTFITLLS